MKTTISSLFLLCCGIITANAQISEKQLKPFIPKGYTLEDTSGDGLKQTSGDILMELISNEPDDFETLVLLHNEKGKLTKIAENNGLLMGKGMLGVSGGNYPSLSGNILSVDYSVGSGSALSDVSIQFEKSKNGNYVFKRYTSITKNHGVENVKERKKITAEQIGKIDFTTAAENEILKTRPGVYRYEPEISVISGTLTKKQFYGAPNYGETPEKDEKVWVYVLKTDKAISVYGNPDEDPETADQTVKDLDLIQTYSLDKKMDLKKYEGKKIKIEGVFQPAINGHHYTPVILEVKKIL
ncbi:MAG: DUF4431 domain-containing protein [Tannerella sp.]|jgi:hypothetical protein|nr:DUF4431 domain-containing protein [Tannerella sp.]